MSSPPQGSMTPGAATLRIDPSATPGGSLAVPGTPGGSPPTASSVSPSKLDHTDGKIALDVIDKGLSAGVDSGPDTGLVYGLVTHVSAHEVSIHPYGYRRPGFTYAVLDKDLAPGLSVLDLFIGCKISAYVNHDIVTEIPGQPPRILGTGLHVGERRARPTRKLFEMALSDVNNAGRMVLGNVGPLARQDSRQGTPNTPWNQDLSTTASTMARHTPYGHDRLTTPPQGRSPGINVVPGVGVWYEGTYTNRSKDFGFIKSPAFPARDVYVSDTSIRGLMPKEGQIVKFRVTDATPGSDSTMGNVASECRILDLSTSGSPLEGEVDELRWFLGEYAVRKENYGFIRCPQFFGRDVYVPDNMILQQRTPEMPMPTDYAGKMVEFRVSSKPEGGGTAATNQFKAIDIRMPQQAIPLLSHGGSTASISPVPSFGNQNSLSSIAGSLQPPASNLPSRNNSGHLGPHPVGSPSPIPSIGRSTPPGRDRSRSPRREGSGVKGPLDAFSKSSADVGMLLEERQTGKGRYRCKVVHWNNDKDYGFIDWGDSENQAHISIHAIRPLGRNKLYRGDVLDCDILERPCGGKFYCDTNNVVFVRHDHQ